jgi:lipoate-protein ligase B
MPEGITSDIAPKVRRSCLFTNLNRQDYQTTLDLQLSTLAAKINTPQTPDHLFFVEHPRVFTLGRRGGQENLMVSKEFLLSQGIQIIQTDRGGNITYHGPGQAVLYPVMDLSRAKIGVADFVYGLEEIMKRTISDFGISADRDPKNHGLWVGRKKIGSVGIAIKRGISIHGLALNVCPDLTPFSWINPCGLENVAMTSAAMEKAMDTHTKNKQRKLMDRVCHLFCQHFSTLFNTTIRKSPCVKLP